MSDSYAQINKKLDDLEALIGDKAQIATKRIPDNVISFMEDFQPYIGRLRRNFRLAPFWIEPLMDQHKNIMFVNGRQTFKTTNCGSLITWIALANPGCEVTYVADDEEHKGAFSEQRLRQEVFLSNDWLRPYLPQGRAAVGRIKLTNGSVIYLVTDENRYHKVEGKSNQVLILDEAQAHDIAYLPVAMYSLSQTKGRVYTFGIGGESGSPYHKMWKRTDQREWIYKDPDWRDKLTFDGVGNITNTDEELAKILAGRWVAQAPQNKNYRGYHFPQLIFPSIPLTMDDARLKYNGQIENSIEYQKKHYPLSMYLSHTVGDFYKAERRPITPDMVEACYNDYLSLLKPEEIAHIKEIFGNKVAILGGVDFGSGPHASSTVVCIIIKWRESGRYQLAYLDPRPQEHAADQSAHIANVFNAANVDLAIGDWGYGQDQVQYIQDGGRDSQDRPYVGMGRKKFRACRTKGDPTQQFLKFTAEVDEKGKRWGRVVIDKSTAIQNFCNFIGQTVAHPIRSAELELHRTKFMIPHLNDWEADMLMDDFCSITRLDIEDDVEAQVEDPRQWAMKKFNHPPDTVMSIIYCLVADQHYKPNAYTIQPIRRKRGNLHNM